MSNLFYAVQVGDCFDWDNGSENYDRAVEMANEAAKDADNDGLEVRIATINVETDFCEEEEIIREGSRI